MNEQEFDQQIAAARESQRKIIKNMIRMLKQMKAVFQFKSVALNPICDFDAPPCGLDEPLEDLLARDRFLHAVRRRLKIDVCLKSRW